MNCDEAQESITALVDQELGHAERSVLEAHMGECSGCRLAFEEELDLKRKIRQAGERMHAPALLRSRILSDRRIFPEKSQSPRQWLKTLWPGSPVYQTALALTVLLLLLLPTYYLSNRISQPVAMAAFETYDSFTRGELPVERTQNSDEIVGRLTRAVDGRFHPMGYDLSAMDLTPVAGMVREAQGRKILVAIYQGEGGSLLCYTFLGSEADAPPNAARFFDPNKKMNFYAFSRAGINAVLHREGDVICILASEMPMDDLLALARKKSRPS
ncbi:MAG TPA: zf-HC2 domain-containing protein [Candidatus Binatia bacterium]